MSGSSCKSAFIYWTRSDAVISSISFCIAWCSSLPFLGNSSSLFFLFLGHIWKPGQVVPKSYPCSMHLGFPDAHAMGFYSFFTEQDEIYYHHDVLSMPFNVYAFQWSWTTMASLFSWLIIFPCPGWWLCLKPSIFPSAASCALLTSCLPQPSEQCFQSLKPVLMNLASLAASGKWLTKNSISWDAVFQPQGFWVPPVRKTPIFPRYVCGWECTEFGLACRLIYWWQV